MLTPGPTWSNHNACDVGSGLVALGRGRHILIVDGHLAVRDNQPEAPSALQLVQTLGGGAFPIHKASVGCPFAGVVTDWVFGWWVGVV